MIAQVPAFRLPEAVQTPEPAEQETVEDLEKEAAKNLEEWGMSHSVSSEDVPDYDGEPKIPSNVERQAQHQCHRRDASWHTHPSSPRLPMSYSKFTTEPSLKGK